MNVCKLLSVSALLAAASCGGSKVSRLVVDSSLSADDFAAAQAAAQSWCSVSSGDVCLTVERGSVDLSAAPEDGTIVLASTPADPFAPASPYTLGATRCPGAGHTPDFARIWIEPTDDVQLFQKTAAHELGHALGLSHYSGPEPSVMHAYAADDTDGPTSEDRQALCALWVAR